jgi:hypothetical protein
MNYNANLKSDSVSFVMLDICFNKKNKIISQDIYFYSGDSLNKIAIDKKDFCIMKKDTSIGLNSKISSKNIYHVIYPFIFKKVKYTKFPKEDFLFNSENLAKVFSLQMLVVNSIIHKSKIGELTLFFIEDNY